MRRLLRMLRPQRGAIVVAMLVLMAQAATLLAGPVLVKHGIDDGLPHGDHGDARALNLAVVVYLVRRVRRASCSAGSRSSSSRGSARASCATCATGCSAHMMSLSLDYFETREDRARSSPA